MLMLCLLPSEDKIEFYNELDITENVTFHNRRAQSQDLRVGVPRLCMYLLYTVQLFVFICHFNF